MSDEDHRESATHPGRRIENREAQLAFDAKRREIDHDATEEAERIAAEEKQSLDEKLERIDSRAATKIWQTTEQADQQASEAAAERAFADAESDRLMREAEEAEERAQAHRAEATIYRRAATSDETDVQEIPADRVSAEQRGR